jgi:hypothetical protein
MPKSRRLILVFVLVLFQIQVLAAATLGCLHGDGSDGLSGVCPNHLPAHAYVQAQPGVGETGDASGALDCIKCALSLGLHAMPGAAPVLPVLAPRSPAVATQPCHFYRLSPDFQLRPPISSFA